MFRFNTTSTTNYRAFRSAPPAYQKLPKCWSPPFQLKRASSPSRDRQVTPFSNPIRESSFCLYTISACITHIKLFLSLVVNLDLIDPTTSVTISKIFNYRLFNYQNLKLSKSKLKDSKLIFTDIRNIQYF